MWTENRDYSRGNFDLGFPYIRAFKKRTSPCYLSKLINLNLNYHIIHYFLASDAASQIILRASIPSTRDLRPIGRRGFSGNGYFENNIRVSSIGAVTMIPTAYRGQDLLDMQDRVSYIADHKNQVLVIHTWPLKEDVVWELLY
jgi:hypothetical protein